MRYSANWGRLGNARREGNPDVQGDGSRIRVGVGAFAEDDGCGWAGEDEVDFLGF